MRNAGGRRDFKMCNKYRDEDGEHRAGEVLDLLTHDGIVLSGKWAGSATREKLKWWASHPGAQLVQTPKPITEVSETAKDDGELQWCDAPDGARLFFVLEASPPGKDYRLAKLITTKATESQEAYFRRDRFPLLGRLNEAGEIEEIPPLPAPAPVIKVKPQGELF